MLTAPVFLLAEEWSGEHLLRVVASNGTTALLCAVLLGLLRRGQGDGARWSLVLGLLALVTSLAWTNGEGVHVNVVNFVFVTVMASVLLGRKALLLVAAASALVLVGIALKQVPAVAAGAEAAERLDPRFESIGQFLPTYTVIVLILWLRDRVFSGRSRARAPE